VPLDDGAGASSGYATGELFEVDLLVAVFVESSKKHGLDSFGDRRAHEPLERFLVQTPVERPKLLLEGHDLLLFHWTDKEININIERRK
jgi:hypothetical protein